MTDAPDSEGLILFRVDGISEPRGEKLVGEVRRPSNRGQKGRRCQLGYTPDTKAALPYWEGGLSPGSISYEKVYVDNGPQRLSLQLVKQLQFRRKEVGRRMQGVQHLGHGRVSKGHHGHIGVGFRLPTLPGPLSLP